MNAVTLLKNTFNDFKEDDCSLRAAALAYATIFSIPPLLILVLMLVGSIWDPQSVHKAMEGQFTAMIGSGAAAQVQSMVQSGDKLKTLGVFPKIVAFIVLILGATGAFGQLQAALNRAWEVRTDPKTSLMKTVLKRVFSFGMVLGIAFLLLVSLVVSAGLASFSGAVTGLLPGGISKILIHIVELVISFGIITLLFAMMFKFIPDAEIAWKDVWTGAAITSLLFTLGKFVIGLYLGHSHPGQAFGAASALAVLLVWIYYSGLIVLFGAELTQTLTEARGRHIEPSKGAIKVYEPKKDANPPSHSKPHSRRHAPSTATASPGTTPDRELHPLTRIITMPVRIINRFR